jgi:hypothetical protein
VDLNTLTVRRTNTAPSKVKYVLMARVNSAETTHNALNHARYVPEHRSPVDVLLDVVPVISTAAEALQYAT